MKNLLQVGAVEKRLQVANCRNGLPNPYHHKKWMGAFGDVAETY